jgi:hypothetical protein
MIQTILKAVVAFVCFAVLSIGSHVSSAQIDESQALPHALLTGTWGKFQLLGMRGSGAYYFRGTRHLAELTFVRQDAKYWYYSQQGGHVAISAWAFSKHADSCGLHSVWRKANDGWKRYEQSEFWLDKKTVTQPTWHDSTDEIQQLQMHVSDLDARVDKLERSKSSQ